MRSRTRMVIATSSVPVLFVVGGFWFHTSKAGASVLGKYSLAYFALASVITMTGAAVVLAAYFLFCEQQITLGPDRRRRIAVSTKLLLVILTAVVLFVSAETVLARIGASEIRRVSAVSVFHPFLQAVPRPGNSYLNINQWGFRGDEISRAKDAQTFRIFLLGGSTVYSDRTRFEKTHARVLQKRLQHAYPRLNIEVQNAGMHWHTSQHSLIKFLSYVQDFQPDLVIFYHAVNDMCRSFTPPRFARGGFRSDYGHFNGPIHGMVSRHLGHSGESHVLVFKTGREIFRRYWYSDLRKQDPYLRQSNPAAVRVTEWSSLDSYRRNTTTLADVVLARDIDLVMASQPFLYREDMTEEEWRRCWIPRESCRGDFEMADAGSMADGIRLFNAVSREVAENRSVVYVDLESLIPKTLEYFRDGVHYTDEANRVIGEAFAQVAIDQGFLEQHLAGAVSVPGS